MTLRPQEYDFNAGIHSLYQAINQRIMHQTNGCKRKMCDVDVVFPYWERFNCNLVGVNLHFLVVHSPCISVFFGDPTDLTSHLPFADRCRYHEHDVESQWGPRLSQAPGIVGVSLKL